MFATMVIVLPSAFTGGDLEISHDGKNTTHSISSNSAYSTSILARYADLLHKVHPLTSGYRLAITYNLVRPTASSSSPPPQIFPPDLTSWHGNLRNAVKQELAKINKKTSVVYLLDHMYPTTLPRYADLKGRDKHLVSALVRFFSSEPKIRFKLALATLDITERVQDGDEDLRRNPGWSLGTFTWMKLSDDGLQVVEYVKPPKEGDTKRRKFAGVEMEFVKGDPRNGSTMVGATAHPAGNEGMSATFWYKHSVLVLMKCGVEESEEVVLGQDVKGVEIDMRNTLESDKEDEDEW